MLIELSLVLEGGYCITNGRIIKERPRNRREEKKSYRSEGGRRKENKGKERELIVQKEGELYESRDRRCSKNRMEHNLHTFVELPQGGCQLDGLSFMRWK